jgi:protein-tyrosine phosphatase
MSVIKVLFICTMNICRSPAAEAVFRRQMKDAGLQRRVRVDSAGIQGQLAGEAPDARMQAAARRRSYDLSRLHARQVRARDFQDFDYLLAMERTHVESLSAACPPEHRHKIALLLDYAPDLARREIPDPYYGGPQGFELVLDLIEEGSRGLRASVIATLNNTPGLNNTPKLKNPPG